MSETELKFGVPEQAVRAIDGTLKRLGGSLVSIESRYFDTVDGRLAAAGVSLRLRKISGRWQQTLKAPGRHAVDRLEETVGRPGRWPAGGPPLDTSLHDGTHAGAALRSALKSPSSDPTPLLHVHTSWVKRRTVEVATGDGQVEIAFDRGEVRAAGRSRPICEVEYELKAGDPWVLIDSARAGIIAHGLWLSTLSKSARGDALAHQVERLQPVRARPPLLRTDMGTSALRRAVMTSCIDQVSANASLLAEGQVDDDVVHQLRVGLRRLRTAAKDLPSDGVEGPPPWEEPIITLFRRLGDYRDRSLVASSIGQRLALAGSPEPALARRIDAVEPVALMRSRDVQLALLDVLAEVLTSPADHEIDAEPPEARQAISIRLDQLHAHLEKGSRRFDRLRDEARHRVRKRLKRLRYLAELVGHLYADRSVQQYLARLRPAQDALGADLDFVVGHKLALERVEAGHERAWFNVGWLSAQRPQSLKRCSKALAKAALAKPFWTRG